MGFVFNLRFVFSDTILNTLTRQPPKLNKLNSELFMVIKINPLH